MMGKLRSYCAGKLFGLAMVMMIMLMQVVKGWSPMLPSLSPFRESSTSSRMVVPKRKAFNSKAKLDSFHKPTTKLYGVLSRSAILKHSGGGGSSSSNRSSNSSSSNSSKNKNLEKPVVTRTFLMDALEEATHRQTTALECLELEHEKLIEKLESAESEPQHKTEIGNCEITEMTDLCISANDDDGGGGVGIDPGANKSNKKERDPRTALDRVATRRLQIRETIAKLEELRRDLVMSGSRSHENNNNNHGSSITVFESRFRAITGSTRKPCSILDRPRDTWKIVAASRSKAEFGRPQGFTGLVFYSPLGVPILVGKARAESDGVLRRASQGSDLWFQVEDYDGSRVLLRSSLVRGTKDSKKCVQMAADLAARYSVWGRSTSTSSYHLDAVPVMYTDSKHVAKRGTKVGRMRKRKSLGRVMGRPSSVEAITTGLEPS